VYRRLLHYLRPYVWPHFVAATACMMLFSATEGGIPLLVKLVLDEVFSKRDMGALRLAVIGILVVALLRGALNFAGSYLGEYVGQKIVNDLRNEINDHIQGLSLRFFNRVRAGQVVSRVLNDVSLVRGAVTDAAASLVRDTATLVVQIGVAIYLDALLALLAFVLFPVTVVPLAILSRQLRRASRKSQAKLGRLNALLHETIQGNRIVKAFSMENYERQRFAAENKRLFRLHMRASRIRNLPLTEVVAGVAIALVFGYGGYSVIQGTRTQGSFVAFLTALFLLYQPYKKLVRANFAIQQGLAGAQRIFALLDTHSEIADRPGARRLTGVREAIEFRDVSFRYEDEWVLRHVDLRIGAGEVVALVGMSGGGKSTLADLIPRFYEVEDGAITFDGVDIRDYTFASLRAHIALVAQFTFLFNDTVRNNIAYGDVSKPAEAIYAAARAANAHEFIAALPQGYDTVIGDLGVKLSGGQRQRIAIARALLKDAPILILDEATSALDTESERLVQDALERLMVGRTTLVVAHRLSTVRRADRIVVLVAGRIIEQGTHEELIGRNAEYRKLYDLQFRDVEAEGTLL
jgi:subfamily B ATP-binding cassette protein MsbA